MIESTQNNLVKYINKLKNKKYRQQYQQFIVEGYHLVDEALANHIVDKIIIRHGIDKYSTYQNIEYVSDKVIDYLCDTNSHSDVLAICNIVKNNIESDHICICYQVQDPGNLGTILRSALSFGFNQVICIDCVDIYNDKVIRSSQGSLYQLNISTPKNIDDVIYDLKEKGYQIVATTLHESSYLQQHQFNSKLAIIMGNEGNGLPEEIIEKSDTHIKIEMATFESLNVAVASSILMYQIFMQK